MQFFPDPEKEYKREMGVVSGIGNGEATGRACSTTTLKQLIYTEHPTAPTIGYSSLVANVDRQEVIDFYKDRYVPQNMLFVVTGDVDTDKVLDRVLKDFSHFARTTERQVTLPAEPETASPRSTRMEMEGPTVHVGLAWPTVPLQDPDLYALDVASFIPLTGIARG